MSRPTVSATVLTYNNAATLDRCLESIDWVDETIVVDSLSTDESVEIARRRGARVVQRPWPGFIAQRNFSKEQARGEWILWIDADEQVPLALRQEMIQALETWDGRIQGYWVPRCSFYLGRWIRHGAWYPDLSIRLFRSAGHVWGGEEPHAAVQIQGPVGRLRNDLLHYNYPSLAHQIRTVDHYSGLSAQELFARGERFRLHKMLLHPLGRFVKEYLLRQGFRDGLPGLIIVAATMFYVFSKYAKLWELEGGGSGGKR